MATKKEAFKIAEKYKAKIDYDVDIGMASAWLDKGEWLESGSDVVMVNYGYKGDMPSVWGELIERMESGLV